MGRPFLGFVFERGGRDLPHPGQRRLKSTRRGCVPSAKRSMRSATLRAFAGSSPRGCRALWTPKATASALDLLTLRGPCAQKFISPCIPRSSPSQTFNKMNPNAQIWAHPYPKYPTKANSKFEPPCISRRPTPPHNQQKEHTNPKYFPKANSSTDLPQSESDRGRSNLNLEGVVKGPPRLGEHLEYNARLGVFWDLWWQMRPQPNTSPSPFLNL